MSLSLVTCKAVEESEGIRVQQASIERSIKLVANAQAYSPYFNDTLLREAWLRYARTSSSLQVQRQAGE